MKLYIETTVPNFLFHDDSPEKQAATMEFFRWAETSTDEFHISIAVTGEIDMAPEPKRAKMREALARLRPQMLETTAEALELAGRYVSAGVLSPNYYADALHVAVAVCHCMDVIISWNLKHLVNVYRIARFNQINRELGMPAIRIHTPEEMMEYEDEV